MSSLSAFVNTQTIFVLLYKEFTTKEGIFISKEYIENELMFSEKIL